MKGFLTTFFIILSTVSNNFISQDIIITKKGDEIESKVIEINQKEITYKKFSNLEGPNYIIPKSDIFMIKYQNGEKELFHQEDTPKEKKTKSDKTHQNHLNLHLTIGSDPKTFENQQSGGAIYGLTFIHFFNSNFGIKTGLSGLYIPIYGTNQIDDNRLGIPIKGVYKNGNKIGFYSEVGFSYYFPVISNWGASNTSYYDQLSGSIEHSGLAFETLLGANYKLNDKFNIYSGLSIHVLPYSYQTYNYSKKDWVTTKESRLGFIGLELGMRYSLQKKEKK